MIKNTASLHNQIIFFYCFCTKPRGSYPLRFYSVVLFQHLLSHQLTLQTYFWLMNTWKYTSMTRYPVTKHPPWNNGAGGEYDPYWSQSPEGSRDAFGSSCVIHLYLQSVYTLLFFCPLKGALEGILLCSYVLKFILENTIKFCSLFR